jgi:hypothetical protein
MHSPPNSALLSKCFLPQPQKQSTLQSLFRSAPASSSTRQATVQFIGDSTVRQLYMSAAQIMDPSLPATIEDAGGEKHSDRAVKVAGKEGGEVVFSFWW